MAIKFDGASKVLNTNPPASISGTLLLFTCGCWVKPTALAGASETVWCITDVGASSNWFRLQISDSAPDEWRFERRDSGGGGQRAVVSPTVFENWSFVLCRAIAANNIRVSILDATGTVTHAQNTTTRNPVGLDYLVAGGLFAGGADTELFRGDLAELWFADIDVQPDNGVTDANLLRQLAYGGPFSVPHVGTRVVEYKSFKKGSSDQLDSEQENSYSLSNRTGVTEQIWSGTVPTSAHPNLPYWYKRPTDVSKLQLV